MNKKILNLNKGKKYNNTDLKEIIENFTKISFTGVVEIHFNQGGIRAIRKRPKSENININ